MIYVDELKRYPSRYETWCHMATDGDVSELHAFARSIGLKRSWFQGHTGYAHYDLVHSKRLAAVAKGAVEVSSKELFMKCFKKDKTNANTPRTTG